MKTIFNISLICFMSIVFFSCKKYADDYKAFLDNKEIKYSGKIGTAGYNTGNLRAQLVWNPSPDPSITKYIITWNNGANKLEVPATSHNPSDLVKVIIPNLDEYVYTFSVVSYDSDGNKSIATEINNVRVYGAAYIATLLNRGINATEPYVFQTDGTLKLNFNKRDTMNVATTIRYTNILGAVEERQLLAADNSIVIPNYKLGTTIQYRSSYYPEASSIDAFNATQFSDFPTIVKYILCDRSLFSELHLPNDAGIYDSNTTLNKLWDGSVGPQGYPNIFHSDGSSGMPQVITFDLGKVYNNLSRIEETGRDCCNNPDRFEVWGIADLTNASTTLRGSDNGWPAEAMSKGWTLLKDITRTDDGKNAFISPLSNGGKPIRYIRIRIKHVTTGDGNYSNMSEIRFWDIQ
jgi:hypothetical protein